MPKTDSELLIEIAGDAKATRAEVRSVNVTVTSHTAQIAVIGESIATLTERSKNVRRELDDTKRASGFLGLGGGGVIVAMKVIWDKVINWSAP